MSTFQSDSRQALQKLQRFCDVVTYCDTLGMHAGGIEDERICLVLPDSGAILGDAERGLVSTGAISALIDSACGAAVLHRLGHAEPIATLDLRVDFLRPLVAGENILCWAWCHRLTHNVAFTHAQVHGASQDETAAFSAGSFMRLKPKLEDDND